MQPATMTTTALTKVNQSQWEQFAVIFRRKKLFFCLNNVVSRASLVFYQMKLSFQQRKTHTNAWAIRIDPNRIGILFHLSVCAVSLFACAIIWFCEQFFLYFIMAKFVCLIRCSSKTTQSGRLTRHCISTHRNTRIVGKEKMCTFRFNRWLVKNWQEDSFGFLIERNREWSDSSVANWIIVLVNIPLNFITMAVVTSPQGNWEFRLNFPRQFCS